MESALQSRPTRPGENFSRVSLTGPATALLDVLWERHGPLMFHQSGGCCDGSAPMCYPAGDFNTGEADELLGVFDLPQRGQLGFWISKEQFAYWSHTHLTVDVAKGRGSGFSLETPEGKRFFVRSEILDIE